MIKRIFLLALVVFLLLTPSLVSAEDKISILHSTAEVHFPVALSFNLKAESQANITKVRLLYQVDRMNYAQVTSEAWPKFTSAPRVETQWIWDMRKASLPPGAKVTYWWIVEDSTGNKIATPTKTVRFDDLRYPWQSLTSRQVTLLWYEGSRAFAQELMTTCQQALTRLANDTGAYLEQPVNIYIYASTKDLQGAMIFPREWTGGAAFTEYSSIALGISLSQLDWGKGALAHELAHLVIHQITFSPYGAHLPTWLDEGLAMYAEGEPDPYLQSWLKKAIAEEKLISVHSLSSPFSAKPEQAYISYAQSQSLIEFLLRNYGKDKMLQLLKLLKTGSDFDEALTKVYGFDQDKLDTKWRAYVTSQMHPKKGGFSCTPPWKTSQSRIFWHRILGGLSDLETLPSPIGVC